ncbi:hypothetical protein [Streptomyces sp. NPDC049040]|uniref:hypothetical protein n=1 Tax=Streptomyces sp. NPDC049040 TaxID=3365593 RepID=UPI003720CEAB
MLSPGFLIASLPPGADTSQVSVGGLVTAPGISAPASGASGVPGTFTVHGSGTTGDTVTVTDGGAPLCVIVWSKTGLPSGLHTLVLTKVDGSYMTFDGLEVDND